MKDFKLILDQLFKEEIETACCEPESKLEFLGNTIFDFTTYDGDADVYFAKKMIEVLDCILNKKTFEYQAEGEAQYVNYLTMVNMPFLADKLEWGGSIRGAWFDNYRKYELCGCELIIEEKELEPFIKDLIEWSKV